MTLGKYFQAVGALNVVGKLGMTEHQVISRVQLLKDKLALVEMRNDLKEVIEVALKHLDAVQNGLSG